MNPQHLYIHYPFCKKKCSYCDFISFPKHEAFVNKYHEALSNEIKTFAQNNKNPHDIKTIFFGGGTPSLYPLELFKNLFKTIHKNFSLKNLVEATIEVNPGDITEKHLATYKSLGINRLSIGVQVLDDKILRSVNREQTNQDVIQLLEIAPKYFNNISVDLMLGLPKTTTELWFKTLDYVASQPITHISIYFLTIYEKTPLYFKIENKTISLPEESWLIETYNQTIDYLKQKDFLQYEISNFAKPGFLSLHNKAYWDRKPYQGFGLSAASFDGRKRLVNSNNLIEYLNCGHRAKTVEILTPQNIALEELMLGLRQKQGVGLRRMIYLLSEEQFRMPKQSVLLFEENVAQLKKENLIEEKNGRISLTTRGRVLENEVIVRLLP
ncbi:radical SAM family heme chaperone HemW [Candidatus Dependentiae bacterium]|nr:radical SAM family heme chaperone HemW [Candidatus Dependentiae bacterium]